MLKIASSHLVSPEVEGINTNCQSLESFIDDEVTLEGWFSKKKQKVNEHTRKLKEMKEDITRLESKDELESALVAAEMEVRQALSEIDPEYTDRNIDRLISTNLKNGPFMKVYRGGKTDLLSLMRYSACAEGTADIALDLLSTPINASTEDVDKVLFAGKQILIYVGQLGGDPVIEIKSRFRHRWIDGVTKKRWKTIEEIRDEVFNYLKGVYSTVSNEDLHINDRGQIQFDFDILFDVKDLFDVLNEFKDNIAWCDVNQDSAWIVQRRGELFAIHNSVSGWVIEIH